MRPAGLVDVSSDVGHDSFQLAFELVNMLNHIYKAAAASISERRSGVVRPKAI
jgi:hypothetical protein